MLRTPSSADHRDMENNTPQTQVRQRFGLYTVLAVAIAGPPLALVAYFAFVALAFSGVW